ncbi:MAG: C-GCAxxG-C-C family protein [Thermoanaerobaculales bacterium]|jgi:C_GCAxxG_C_C family probable redox protein|nr:C-GCAxxG-C-C family protein [Thermoanaerobaculales bacterium]
MEDLKQLALSKLAETKNCAQATFYAIDQHCNLGGGDVLRALTPFPGIALRGETCGAVTGAMMALGLAFGTDTAEDEAAVFAAYAPARELCHRLEKMHGSTQCADLLEKHLGQPVDFTSAQDLEFYRSSGGYEACAGIVVAAANIAAEIIERGRTVPDP